MSRLLGALRHAIADDTLAARLAVTPPIRVLSSSVPPKLSGPVRAAAPDVRACRVQAIERARQAYGISHERLGALSGVSRSWYATILRAPHRASDVVIERLTRGLQAGRAGAAASEADKARELALIRSTFRGFVLCLCGLLRADVEFALAWSPASGPRGNALPAEQRQAIRARQCAVYLTNVALGVRQRRLAEALGITPAAVTQLLHTVEDLRDDPELDRVIGEASRTITGEAA